MTTSTLPYRTNGFYHKKLDHTGTSHKFLFSIFIKQLQIFEIVVIFGIYSTTESKKSFCSGSFGDKQNNNVTVIIRVASRSRQPVEFGVLVFLNQKTFISQLGSTSDLVLSTLSPGFFELKLDHIQLPSFWDFVAWLETPSYYSLNITANNKMCTTVALQRAKVNEFWRIKLYCTFVTCFN